MAGRQYTLGQLMKAVAIVAIVLAIAVQRPDLFALLLVGVLLLILAVCLYGLSKLPPRVRFTIMLAAAVALLIYSAWVWQPPFYVVQAHHVEELARLCSTLAEKANDNRSSERFLHESAKFRRLAFRLRLRAMWYGLIRSVTRENPVPMTGPELIFELDLLEAMDKYEKIATPMGVSYQKPERRWSY
jgi:hypothetical protein